MSEFRTLRSIALRVKGVLTQTNGHWSAICSTLDIALTASSKTDCIKKVRTWVVKNMPQIKCTVEACEAGQDEFAVFFADPKPVLGWIVRSARQQAGCTLQEVANRVGARTRSSVSVFETGRYDPKISTAHHLLETLGYELQVELVRKR